ncbi:MAG: DUF4129 domain-containing protein [Fimbriimonadaceae bacterium]|nr:DUF4129 domain-containing protein [Fimbriimonadaceae bacterium]QYK59285.1 MAG: DUF4129 domain-containing protein [Fimbriimonadaceae bacterium]
MIRASALFCFLSLVAAHACGETSWTDALRNAESGSEFERIAQNLPEELREDRFLSSVLQNSEGGSNWKAKRDRLVRALDAKERTRDARPPLDAQAAARTILRDVRYRDPGESKGSSWLGQAMARFRELINEWLERIFGHQSLNAPAPGLALGALEPIVWGLLALTLAVATFLVVRNTHWAALRRRKSVGGLLDDDEPDRTADEWLSEADRLDSIGRHREAVRCLYIACLVRLDDARVSAFVRTETNWEHVRRIEGSPSLPEGIEFRQVTRLFDRVWYGFLDQNPQSTAELRSFYVHLMSVLKAAGRLL